MLFTTILSSKGKSLGLKLWSTFTAYLPQCHLTESISCLAWSIHDVSTGLTNAIWERSQGAWPGRKTASQFGLYMSSTWCVAVFWCFLWVWMHLKFDVFFTWDLLQQPQLLPRLGRPAGELVREFTLLAGELGNDPGDLGPSCQVRCNKMIQYLMVWQNSD